MIATSNAEQKTSSNEEVNPSIVDERAKTENLSENNESYSSEKTLDTSISNTSPNTLETISTIENNFKTTKNNPHFYDQSMNGYQPNYGYGFCPPQFYGFDNPQMNNFGYQFVNPYYDYQQQMMFYPNYPTYFPTDFPPNWNSYAPKNFYQDNQRKYRNNSNNNNNNNNNQKMNQNADANGYQQRRYKKPFNRRGENQKPEEEKPKIVDYDLMKNEQVYVDAFPALEPNSSEKTSQQSAKQDENNSTDEAIGVNKENELKRVNSGGWAGKKWSEIVNGNQVYPEYHEANGSKQKDNGESSLEKQMNGLKIYSDSDSNKMSCWSQPIKC
ncbi:hypothetical protein BpHYR1_038087 [Brachionus plicatilis]|uniref:Uncharacterized protein n=1 Tax=Brachionus plicatilis TaxID=10195 RepID=A0A3M7Q358_BRAPC|nr:hypothetical protein BpHYR1_038087 [Brachionus plicatilis]